MGQPRKAPLHLPIAVGLTTGLYAVSLAGVTALQAQTDGATIAAQQPATNAVAGLSARRTALEADLRETVASLNRAGAAYNASLDEAAAYHEALTSLARLVQSATGAAARVPTIVGLPAAARASTTVTTAAPAHATTGGSTVVP